MRAVPKMVKKPAKRHAACPPWQGALLLLAAGAAGFAHAHPYHDSLAEMDYREECACFEIAIRLDPLDIEATLQRQLGEPLPLEAARMQAALQRYIAQKFELLVDGKPASLAFIGSEADVRGAWVFLKSGSLNTPSSGAPLQLRNELLMEADSSQINRVLVRNGRGRASLRYSHADPRVQVFAVPEAD
jgi:hypothetical protein